METIGKLFGSADRVKIMRLFLLNPEQVFEADDISKRSRVSKKNLNKELALLQSVGFAKKRDLVKVLPAKSKKKQKGKAPRQARGKQKTVVWTLNHGFIYVSPLKDLLIETNLLKKEDLVSRFKTMGKVKLLIISGILIRQEGSRVDLLIVGDSLKKGAIEKAIKGIEAELGKELTYSILSTDDFFYRFNMQDKLIRDILEYPHEKVIDLTGLKSGN